MSPETEAGRHYVATMFGRERSDVFDVTQTEAKMVKAIRLIEAEARQAAEARVAVLEGALRGVVAAWDSPDTIAYTDFSAAFAAARTALGGKP